MNRKLQVLVFKVWWLFNLVMLICNIINEYWLLVVMSMITLFIIHLIVDIELHKINNKGKVN